MRRTLASLAAMVLAIAPALAQGIESRDKGDWHLTIFEGASCNASRHAIRPSLTIEVAKGGDTALRLMGLQMPAADDPRGLLGAYPAEVKVSHNGAEVFAGKVMKEAGSLEIEKIGFDKLEAIAAPGQIIFELKGDSGQHETISYDST